MAPKSKPSAAKRVDPSMLRSAFAAAVAAGDMVNFRFLFGSFSPGRPDSSERFEDARYACLQPAPELQRDPSFALAAGLLDSQPVRDHMARELAAKRPAQLPWELVLMLADNAVRLGKYTSAAQAYETLRIRRRMQELFYGEGKSGLAARNLEIAVRGFRIAAALDYDYAAFPEPLPKVPDYQKRALIVHGRYPAKPEDLLPLMPESDHVNALIGFLLNDSVAAAWLSEMALELRISFAAELVRQIDPQWDSFVERYGQACTLTRTIGEALLQRDRKARGGGLEVEIAEQQIGSPSEVMARMLGTEIEGGDWWEYLKEIAYRHPAGIFFMTRQLVGDREVLLPRYRANSLLGAALGVVPGAPVNAAG